MQEVSLEVNSIPAVHTVDFKQRKVEYMENNYGNEANTRNVEVLSSVIADHRY